MRGDGGHFNESGSQPGIWKSGRGKSRKTPKGRQVCDQALQEVRTLLGNRPRQRDLLIEYLHLIQDQYGYLGAGHLRALAKEMRLSQAEVYEVATFYAHFDVVREGETPPPAITIRVCDSLSCELAGAEDLLRDLKAHVDPSSIRVVPAPCMGRCDTAPVLEIGHRHIDEANVQKVLDFTKRSSVSVDIPPYINLQSYLDDGGYMSLRHYQAGQCTVDEVQQTISNSGLQGFGGTGFPAARKWSSVRAEQGPRLMAVNADEGEPGKFKDRYYLEHEPHSFLEDMLIASWAVKAESVYIYLRDEYPASYQILTEEIQALEEAKIVPAGHIHLRRGAGAYICGGESAMIESIKGKRDLPRHRLPYVAQVGLFNRPTLVHNMETLYWVAKICREGPEILSRDRHNGRTGLRSYSVSGRVAKPGMYVLPVGSTILDIIEAAGGMKEGHEFRFYQPGGPSSGMLPASLNNVPLDFDTLQPHRSFVGSGAVVVMSQADNAKSAPLNMMRFFESESCGQCTPCRVGCEKAVKLMSESVWDAELLEDLCQVMEDSSICGLGQAAPNAIRLTMRHFPEDVGLIQSPIDNREITAEN